MVGCGPLSWSIFYWMKQCSFIRLCAPSHWSSTNVFLTIADALGEIGIKWRRAKGGAWTVLQIANASPGKARLRGLATTRPPNPRKWLKLQSQLKGLSYDSSGADGEKIKCLYGGSISRGGRSGLDVERTSVYRHASSETIAQSQHSRPNETQLKLTLWWAHQMVRPVLKTKPASCAEYQNPTLKMSQIGRGGGGTFLSLLDIFSQIDMLKWI